MDRARHIAPDRCERSAFRGDAAVARLAAEQWGVVSTGELHACGMSRAAITRRRERGHLHRLHVGVWAVGHANPPWEGRLLAAVKACGPRAVLSHYSAAELWGLVDRIDRVPDVTVVAGAMRSHPGIRTHRCRYLAVEDAAVRYEVPVTSPARALLELARALPRRRVRAAVRRGLGIGVVTLRQVGWMLDRYPGQSGSKALREAITSGVAPTKSDRESDVLDLLLDAGFAHPDVNLALAIGGRRVIPDFRWPEQRLVVEVDSTAWHEDPLARADDRERQAVLEANGETVMRVHWRDAVLRPRKLIERLRAAGAPGAPRRTRVLSGSRPSVLD